MPLLHVENLKVSFQSRGRVIRAVDGVSFTVEPQEALGIVGESGSGKTVAMLALLGLIPSPPGRIEDGTALFEGTDLLRASSAELRRVRGRRIAMVFQEPMTALNPYVSIGKQLTESVRAHERCSRAEAERRAVAALEEVGMYDAPSRLRAYPHELSGGMRQRVMIAMALALRPALVIADEPTTALDVTVEAQILDLMVRLQRGYSMSVILITHNLGVIAETCRRVAVMYAGRILETASTVELFHSPRHPYTEALMGAMPAFHARGERLRALPGSPPDLSTPRPGCPFADRCAHVVPDCRTGPVRLEEVAPGRSSACIRVQRGEM